MCLRHEVFVVFSRSGGDMCSCPAAELNNRADHPSPPLIPVRRRTPSPQAVADSQRTGETCVHWDSPPRLIRLQNPRGSPTAGEGRNLRRSGCPLGDSIRRKQDACARRRQRNSLVMWGRTSLSAHPSRILPLPPVVVVTSAGILDPCVAKCWGLSQVAWRTAPGGGPTRLDLSSATLGCTESHMAFRSTRMARVGRMIPCGMGSPPLPYVPRGRGLLCWSSGWAGADKALRRGELLDCNTGLD